MCRWLQGRRGSPVRSGVGLLPVTLLLAGLLSACGGGGGGGDAAPGPAPGPGPAVDYFPLEAGNRWYYQSPSGTSSTQVVGTRSVAGRSVYVLDYNSSLGLSEQLIERTSTGLVLVSAPGADPLDAALDGVPVLRLPLVVGRSETPVDRDLPGIGDLDGDGRPDRINVRATTTMVGFETLNTPAGNFSNVARVRTVVNQVITLTAAGRPFTSVITSDDWYAPNVGPVQNSITVVDDSGSSTETLTLQAWRAGALRSENVAPTVTETTPAADSLNRGLVDITMAFSETMFAPSLNEGGGFVLTGPGGQPVAGRVEPLPGLTGSTAPPRFAFRPTAGQALAGGSYTATLGTAAQDLAGNGLAAPRSWRFTVDAAGPQVASVSPASGEDAVPVGSLVRITFDEAPDPASLTPALSLIDDSTTQRVPISFSLDGRTVTITPTAPLAERRSYTVEVSLNVRDTLGNFASASWTSSFRTEPGRFSYAQALNLPGSGVVYGTTSRGAVAFGDVDGDGRGDLVVVPGGSGTTPAQPLAWIWRMQTDGQLRTPLRVEAPAGYTCPEPALVVLDFDGDGRQDLAAGSECGLALYRQGADGVLALREVLPAQGLLRLRAADMDGDGRRDLVGIGWSGPEAWIWTQLPGGGFGPRTAHAVDYFGWSALALGDFNGDGRNDIAISGANTFTQSVGLLPQRADGSFGPPTYAAVDAFSGARGVAVGDINGDGRADVVAGTLTGNNVQRLLQLPDGSLGAPQPLAGTPGSADVALADMNGDARLDLVVATDGSVWVFEQRADGSLGAPTILSGFSGHSLSDTPQGLLIADLDGNGLPDIVLHGSYMLQRRAAAGAAPVTPSGVVGGRPGAGLSRALRPGPAPPTSAR